MDQRTRAIVIGAGTLFALAIISLAVFFALRLSRNIKPAQPSGNSNSLSRLPTLSITPSPASAVVPSLPAAKTFVAAAFSLDYPSSWGLLTCSNSTNFEFDPVEGSDVKNVICDRAVKPITIILVNRLNCLGETVKIGDKQVIKSKSTQGNNINYRWCVPVGNIGLDITHRVSPNGSMATSKEDFSTQIEQLIETIKASPRAS